MKGHICYLVIIILFSIIFSTNHFSQIKESIPVGKDLKSRLNSYDGIIKNRIGNEPIWGDENYDNVFGIITNPHKVIQNGAIRSEGKTFGSDWVLTKRSISTYENNLNIKNGYLYLEQNSGLTSSNTNFYDSNQRLSKVVYHRQLIVYFYTYDVNNRLIEIVSERNGGNYTRTTHSYNASGLRIESLYENWTNSEWVNSVKTEYSYDVNGFLIGQIRYIWSSSTWRNSRRTAYVNNSTGFSLSIISELWSGTEWVNSYKYNYTRNSNNLISESIYSTWNSNTLSWDLIEKSEFTYTSNDEPLLTQVYSYNSSIWQLYFREEFEIMPSESILVIDPSGGSYLNNFTVHWIGYGINSIDIQFSSNSGNTWTTIATNLPDTGHYSFNYEIPNVNYMNCCKVRVINNSNPSVYAESSGLFSVVSETTINISEYYFDANKIKLPIDQKGVIAAVNVGPSGAGGTYDDKLFLFSGGFFLSGNTSGVLWANGVLTASLINDYQGGVANAPSYDNKIYIGKSSNVPFGPVWLSWQDAVNLGASFYDGNNDGIYNPVDLNGNGIWDSNEDRPDFISDRTAWCVFNDGVPSYQRRFNDVEPQKIEVHQTIFASSDQNSHAYNIVFIRYRLKNTGYITSDLNSVYFSVALDPDLGTSTDDLVGCDTIINSGFCYQKNSDGVFGYNPPVFLARVLQGPHSYIPGVTFIDNNGNSKYDYGIDTPLDTAFYKNGPYLGINSLPGAKNLPMTSFTQYMQSHPTHGDPSTRFELRNYMVGGLDKNGSPLNVCNWVFGNGNTLPNCSEINPKYMYSGDPMANSGWINTTAIDQRMMLNTGPFDLEYGQPVDIIVAYVVGRGDSPLNSLVKAGEIAQAAELYYYSNFTNLPTSIENGELLSKQDYYLHQNYPNPFNPVTTIRFSVPSNVKPSLAAGKLEKSNHQPSAGAGVKLVVYDMLGREVATLINEEKQPGTYEIKFDASGLTSGVYFYRLKAGSYIETKKMILLR